MRLADRLSRALRSRRRPSDHDVRVARHDYSINLVRPRPRRRRMHWRFEHLRLATEARVASPQVTIDLGFGAMQDGPLFTGHYIGIGLPKSHGRAQAALLRDCYADVITFAQQLEDAADPWDVLAEMRPTIRPQGTLLPWTHGVSPYCPDPQHLWRCTEKGLTDTVRSVEVTHERVHHQGGLSTTGLLRATYPPGGLRQKAPCAARVLTGALLATAKRLERLATGTGLGHLASPSYSIVARRLA